MSDHPRTCGANRLAAVWYTSYVGSSPHMRGKLRGISVNLLSRWIIPAHAGQTSSVCIRLGVYADHPRTCGANQSKRYMDLGKTGSSPHMRGKRLWGRRARAAHRIIPAHAGQTSTAKKQPAKASDHPRTCGANLRIFGSVGTRFGSSPHMRGKLPYFRGYEWVERIIPAHAGQTNYAPTLHRTSPDHPRTCGANLESMPAKRMVFGSSPHMRGKLSGVP